MTRGEILAVLGEVIEELWDDRNWSLSLLTKEPVENYQKGVEKQEMAEQGDKVDELKEEQQSWLRAVE